MEHADFVHLHIHTQYSLLDGACQLDKLTGRAKRYKLPALAITDHGNLFGAIKFYNQCLSKGIKPIIGCEVYVAADSRFKKDYKQNEDSNYHLLLLAKNETGYHNLLKLTSLGYLEGFYYKPRIDKELLAQYNKGLIGLSACLKGEIPSSIIKGDINKAYKLADTFLSILGKENFYLEIMDNGLKEQLKVNKCLLKMSQELGIPIVATNDVHYLDKVESFAHEVLLCIQTQTTLNDPNRFRFGSDTFYFRSPEEMKNIFKEIPKAIKNTLEITQKCNLIFDFSKVYLPKFPLPSNFADEFDYLKYLCYEGLKIKYPQGGQDVINRLEYELGVIRKTGFASYFLIIWDLIKFAKDNKIPVGPGRGSAAGSIVSYLLGITDIDPLKYNLIFERFLNPARISMPDIDIDFCYEKRQGILDYVAQRYGKDNVAQIITFGTMLAKAVIRDVGRVMGLSYNDVDRIAKMIPYSVGHSISLKEALETIPELKTIYTSDLQIKRLINVAMQLEGLSRHASTHAAGVVISDRPLIERIPLIKGNAGEIITAYDMDSLEKTGMLKMDFLGLKTLTVINETLKIIKRIQNIELDIDSIPLDDSPTFNLLAKGETIGVFQLESRGMRDLLRRIKPSDFKDLIAILALYRPGPLASGMVDDYIERKHGRKPVTYLHPKLESILKETYGIILYQEQTMQIASELAGFSLTEADLLRKAIGKKIPEIMQEEKKLFIDGCIKNNIPEKTANVIFDLIDYFSGYGFNKSHSTAYALISYRTAYLKANYPTEFIAALLTSERNNTDKIVLYVNEAEKMNIKVLPPDINESYADFTVTGRKTIRFGLRAIKNVGQAAIESIINVRREGKFKDFFDFCYRVDSRSVNKKVMESLIKSGALDSFGLKRAQMMMLLDKVLTKAARKQKTSTKQLQLFDLDKKEEKIPRIEEWPINQILQFEKSLLGMYVSSHPLNSYETLRRYLNVKDIIELYDSQQGRSNDWIIMGIIEKVKLTTTRKEGKRMAIVKLSDKTSSIEIFVFPRIYEMVGSILKENKVVVVKGKLSYKENTPNLLVDDIFSVEQAWERIKEAKIFIDKNRLDLKRLKLIFQENKGKTPVYFVLNNPKFRGVVIKAADNFHINVNQQLIREIEEVVGISNFLLTL